MVGSVSALKATISCSTWLRCLRMVCASSSAGLLLVRLHPAGLENQGLGLLGLGFQGIWNWC